MKKPDAPSAPISTRDQDEKAKVKEKMNKEIVVVGRNYTTRGTKNKLLSDAL